MNTCKLIIRDEVNVKFEGLDPSTRRRMVEMLKFLDPRSRHYASVQVGHWDGKVAFATVGGATYFNLLDRVMPMIENAGYRFELEDRRPDRDFKFPEVTDQLLADKIWPEGHPLEGEQILLREHQVRAINTYLANLKSVQSISTSAGKTIITGALSLLAETYGRTICIVPNKSLVEQTEEDYRNIGLDVGVYYGDRKEIGHTHTICTWQSLSVFAKKVRNKKGKLTGYDYDVGLETKDDVGNSLGEFLKGVTCVMIDECHTVNGKELQSLLTGPMAHVPIRWGLTGTVPKEDFQFVAVLSCLGPVVGKITAFELQELGILSKCHVHIKQTVDDHVEFKTYHAAYEFLTTDAKRLAWIADYCKGLKGNVLVLVDRIECGETLAELLDAEFVSGEMKTKDRKKRYKEITDDTSIPIVATYGVAAVGINIPALHHIVLIEAGKSFVRTIQSIGRGLRRTKQKDYVDIHDICSTNKWSKTHLTARKGDYRDAQYPHSVEKVKYR
jgi:superfamily II DNA or RNA helicase